MIDNNELINQIKSYNRFLNINTVSKAYNFALEAHQNQKRDEGVPYIIHPVAVAKINFLKFSALEPSDALFSSAEILVTPSTKLATSSPNSFLTLS